MNREKLFSALGGIDPRYVAEAVRYAPGASNAPSERSKHMKSKRILSLALALKPLAVLGVGKPSERGFLMPCHEGDSLDYYRKDGVHFVPKLQVEDLLV